MEMNENANMQTDELEEKETHACDNLSYQLPPMQLILESSSPAKHKCNTEQDESQETWYVYSPDGSAKDYHISGFDQVTLKQKWI